MLILKTNNLWIVTDFETISLCNVCYKAISKLLSNHLKKLYLLIGLEQSGFFLQRYFMDNIMAIQEVAHSIEFDINSLLGWC